MTKMNRVEEFFSVVAEDGSRVAPAGRAKRLKVDGGVFDTPRAVWREARRVYRSAQKAGPTFRAMGENPPTPVEAVENFLRRYIPAERCYRRYGFHPYHFLFALVTGRSLSGLFHLALKGEGEGGPNGRGDVYYEYTATAAGISFSWMEKWETEETDYDRLWVDVSRLRHGKWEAVMSLPYTMIPW